MSSNIAFIVEGSHITKSYFYEDGTVIMTNYDLALFDGSGFRGTWRLDLNNDMLIRADVSQRLYSPDWLSLTRFSDEFRVETSKQLRIYLDKCADKILLEIEDE